MTGSFYLVCFQDSSICEQVSAHSSYVFISWWILGLFLLFAYEQCFCEHGCTSLVWVSVHIFLGYIPRSTVPESQSNCQPTFQSIYTISHSQKQHMKVKMNTKGRLEIVSHWKEISSCRRIWQEEMVGIFLDYFYVFWSTVFSYLISLHYNPSPTMCEGFIK